MLNLSMLTPIFSYCSFRKIAVELLSVLDRIILCNTSQRLQNRVRIEGLHPLKDPFVCLLIFEQFLRSMMPCDQRLVAVVAPFLHHSQAIDEAPRSGVLFVRSSELSVRS